MKEQSETSLGKPKIAVLGLGYVGLPLAIEFAKHYKTIGFVINEKRVQELNNGRDHTLEADEDVLRKVLEAQSEDQGLFCTADAKQLKECNYFIITVPTPIDENNKPDLTPLIKASQTVGKVLDKGDIVVYESTVYPGATEEECVPILEEFSNLKFNEDFFVGYSPERINHGDKLRTVTKIIKVTSGSTPESAERIDRLYKSIITAGTHKASSIKVAEAAKVIENAQRDINIAFVNELARIFNRLDIDTRDVLEAAQTKWNFLNFQPGLVGGHCIGVDPYYLAQKAQQIGYHPEIILAGRRLNDGMGEFIAQEVIKQMTKKDIRVKDANILILGITFKENCPDVRNTRVVDILWELKDYGANITLYDPWAISSQVKEEYGWDCVNNLEEDVLFDAVVLAVAHDQFKSLDLRKITKQNRVIYDVKGILDREIVDSRL